MCIRDRDERAQAQRALHIGIAMDEQRAQFTRGDFLIRNLLGADQQTGAIVVGDVIQEGQTVQFQVRDAQSADEDLHALLAASRLEESQRPLGALLFSCCAVSYTHLDVYKRQMCGTRKSRPDPLS